MPKTNDLFVDTSAWACYLCHQDTLHSEFSIPVQHALKRRQHLVTTNFVITELVVLLSSRYRLPRQQVVTIIDAVKMDATIEIVHIDQALDNQAWKLLRARLDKEWSLVDASSFVVMTHYGLTEALTTDHHFIQAGFRRIPEQ